MSSSQRETLDRQRERVLAYYERVLTNIRDLDEDHITGKIAEDEYNVEREVWVQRGIKLLKVIDELESKKSLVASSDDAEIDSAIEAAIAEKKQQIQEVS
jgi:Asp-tRNA(Asn)/Glu-tRNA(Gln) amidotransferase B subunit